MKFILAYVARTKAIAYGYMWWPELNRQQIEEMTKNFSLSEGEECTNSGTTPPMELAFCSLAGPFQEQTFFIIVDSHSKWPGVVAMKKTTTEATICEWCRLFSCYGLPE